MITISHDIAQSQVYTGSGLLDTAKWPAIRIISIQTATLPSLPSLLAGPGNFDITLANCSPDYDTWYVEARSIITN